MPGAEVSRPISEIKAELFKAIAHPARIRALVDWCLERVTTRRSYGVALADHQLVQGRIADMHVASSVVDALARETGWEIRYSDPSLARSAGTITLHGAMGPVTPDQAPEVVLRGAGLTSEIRDGIVRAGRQEP